LRKEESHVPPSEERKKKQRAWWMQVESANRESILFQVPLKLTLPHGRAGPGGSHSIMNEWGEAWAVASQVRVV
jgi:hypothetical protein